MYTQGVSHHHRAAIVVIVDCSTSMRKCASLNGMPMIKADAAALITNFIIDELLDRARRYDEVRDYYDIAVIGYSGDGVVSMLPGDGKGFISITRLAEMEPQPRTYYIDQTRPDGTRVKAPFVLHPWIEPEAHGTSPMFEALIHVKGMVAEWCKDGDNRDSLPPIVFHITDGDCNDTDAWSMLHAAQDITNTSTYNGNTLLLNIVLLTMGEEDFNTKVFPAEATYHSTDRNRMLLLRMSSLFPEELEPRVKGMFHLTERGPYRAIAFNTSITEFLNIISIGTENVERY